MRFAFCLLALATAFASEAAAGEATTLGNLAKSLDGLSVNSTASSALLAKIGKKRSTTLDHFNDKIDEVCIELAKEVQNASKCLAPAAYDLRVKSMSFQRVLEYYEKEITTFRDNWRAALKKFTDNAQTFIDNPLQGSLIQEKELFGVDVKSLIETGSQKKDGAPLGTVVPAIEKSGSLPGEEVGPDHDKAIKEFRQPWDHQAKQVPDHRDYDIGPNIDQKLGYEINDEEKPLDRLDIDQMHPFPTAKGWDTSGTTGSVYRQKYGETFEPVKTGEEAPQYVTDRMGADIFNIETYAQRFLFWRNEHIAALNNLVFATGPYQASAMAYASVLEELAKQVEQIKKTTLLTFQGYYEGPQNKKIENAIRLYQQRSFKREGDTIPDEVKAFQTSPMQQCGICETRTKDKNLDLLAPEGVCLPNELWPCGPQRRTDGTLALNPYYLWNDSAELWKRRFQLMDGISSYFFHVRKVSLKQKGYVHREVNKLGALVEKANATVHGVGTSIGANTDAGNNAEDHSNDADAFADLTREMYRSVQVVHEKVNHIRDEVSYEDQKKLNANKAKFGIDIVSENDMNPVAINNKKRATTEDRRPTKEDYIKQNRAQYIADNDMTNRWDLVNEAQTNAIPMKYGYRHPAVKDTEPMSQDDFKSKATKSLDDELAYNEVLQNGRWEKMYNDAMDKLVKDYGMSLDFLREESFQLAYQTARDKFDQCSSTLKKRVPGFMAVDAAAMAAESNADKEEKATSPDYRDHITDLLQRFSNAQEGTAIVSHEAMMCVEAARYELELSANAYRLVLLQMANDVRDTATRWSDNLKDLGTAWAGSAFSGLISTSALPTVMMQRSKGVLKVKHADRSAIEGEVKKAALLKMQTPNELYSDIDINFNPRDFVLEYRFAYWKTREAFLNIYRHFTYTMGPYKAATDAYLASMSEFSSEIDHKIETFLGKGNDAIVDGSWTHENTYNMYWSGFKNSVGLIRTAKHIVAQARKNAGYIQQFLMRAFHMRLDNGKMIIGGCDPANYAKGLTMDGHKYDESRPTGKGHLQEEGNRLGRGTHPCFLGQYTNVNGYVEALPMITWLANEYDNAFGTEDLHGDPMGCKKTKKILGKYRCNGGDNRDEVEAPEQYPTHPSDGNPGQTRFDRTKCVRGHMLVDQALYKLAYQTWLSHVEHTEATSFADWLGYDDELHKPNMKDYAPCTPYLHNYVYIHYPKSCVSDKSPIIQTLLNQTVLACQQACDEDEECRSVEYGVDYGGMRNEAKDCHLRTSVDYYGCDGEQVNTDVYMKKVTSCQAFEQGNTVETAAKPYKIAETVTLNKDGKAKAKKAVVAKKSGAQQKHRVYKKKSKRARHTHHKRRPAALKGKSFLEIKERAMQNRAMLKAQLKSKDRSPAGFRAYMYCDSDDDCDHAPGSEGLPRLKCEYPMDNFQHTQFSAKAKATVEEEKSRARKFCVGPGKEGDHCNKFLCSFGMSCSKSEGGKCVRDSYKYHDWWTYDDGLTTHASTNTFGLEYRKARDYFLSCNDGMQKSLTGFVDAWAAANQLAHRMEERVCGGQVLEQEGTGTELGLLQAATMRS